MVEIIIEIDSSKCWEKYSVLEILGLLYKKQKLTQYDHVKVGMKML